MSSGRIAFLATWDFVPQCMLPAIIGFMQHLEEAPIIPQQSRVESPRPKRKTGAIAVTYPGLFNSPPIPIPPSPPTPPQRNLLNPVVLPRE